jgi:hypothetical protein
MIIIKLSNRDIAGVLGFWGFGVGVLALRYFFGPFLGRRKFIRRFTWSKVDIKKDVVIEKMKREQRFRPIIPTGPR